MDPNFYQKLYSLGLDRKSPQTLEQLGVEIKIAQEGDWPDYKRIMIEAFNTDKEAFNLDNPERVAQEMHKEDLEWKKDITGKIIILSIVNKEPVAVLKSSRDTDSKDKVWLVNVLYVSPNFRKRVTGSPLAEKMLFEVLDEIRKRDGSKVRLWVKKLNRNAIRLYKKVGFEKVNFARSPQKMFTLTDYRPDAFLKWTIMEKDL